MNSKQTNAPSLAKEKQQSKRGYGQENEFHLVRRSQALHMSSGFASSDDQYSNVTHQHVAITSTTALVSIFLTAFTLFALYTGLQNNVTVFTSQQATLKNQIQLCLLLPLLMIYFTVVALEDYVRTFFSFNLSTKHSPDYSVMQHINENLTANATYTESGQETEETKRNKRKQ